MRPSVSALARANNISNPNLIRAGTTLNIPGRSGGSPSAGRPSAGRPSGPGPVSGSPGQFGSRAAHLANVAQGFFRRAARDVPQNVIEEFINEAGQEIIKDFAVQAGGFPAHGGQFCPWKHLLQHELVIRRVHVAGQGNDLTLAVSDLSLA